MARCRDDYPTKMRLKYAPFYHAMEAQKGTTVRLDGKDVIHITEGGKNTSANRKAYLGQQSDDEQPSAAPAGSHAVVGCAQ